MFRAIDPPRRDRFATAFCAAGPEEANSLGSSPRQEPGKRRRVGPESRNEMPNWNAGRFRATGGSAVPWSIVLLSLVSCSGEADPDASARSALLLDPSNPEWVEAAPPVWRARFETSKGHFLVEVEREAAPIGVDRFYNLIRLGYYDDTRFHRVSQGYIVQFGLHGDPAVNAAWLNQQLEDDPAQGSNVRGTFAFAMSPEPRTRNTQIYINLDDNTRNDQEPFSIFGRVIEGMDVVDQLYSGYGEESGSGVRHGRQGPIIEGGNEYLDREFPLLDRLVRAKIIGDPVP